MLNFHLTETTLWFICVKVLDICNLNCWNRQPTQLIVSISATTALSSVNNTLHSQMIICSATAANLCKNI